MKPQMFVVKSFIYYDKNEQIKVKERIKAYTCSSFEYSKFKEMDILIMYNFNGTDETHTLLLAHEDTIENIYNGSHNELNGYKVFLDEYKGDSKGVIKKIVIENMEGKNTQVIRLSNII